MNQKWNRLRAGNHKVIANIRQAGKAQETLAQAIGLSRGTIWTDLSGNCGRSGYRSGQADHLATERKNLKRKCSKVIVGIIKDGVELD